MAETADGARVVGNPRFVVVRHETSAGPSASQEMLAQAATGERRLGIGQVIGGDGRPNAGAGNGSRRRRPAPTPPVLAATSQPQLAAPRSGSPLDPSRTYGRAPGRAPWKASPGRGADGAPRRSLPVLATPRARPSALSARVPAPAPAPVPSHPRHPAVAQRPVMHEQWLGEYADSATPPATAPCAAAAPPSGARTPPKAAGSLPSGSAKAKGLRSKPPAKCPRHHDAREEDALTGARPAERLEQRCGQGADR
jgi:hypothetical protein